MRIVAISDTHSLHQQVTIPDGDLLIHAGDFTRRGREREIRRFNAWLETLPHPHKIVVAGNHDFMFEREPERAQAMLTAATYLRDSGCTIDGVRLWGSPWQPEFFDWAFNLPRGPALAEKWALIPDDTDVLITHGPPHQVLDETFAGLAVGCEDLVDALERVRPKVHIFGHIHEGYGRRDLGRTTFLNASICTLGYEATNAPLVFDL